jgi:hypothetical protein
MEASSCPYGAWLLVKLALKNKVELTPHRGKQNYDAVCQQGTHVLSREDWPTVSVDFWSQQ